MDSHTKVTVTVHERVDSPGFVVKVVVEEDGANRQRVARFATDTQEEADALAASIHHAASAPGGMVTVEALLAGATTEEQP